MATKHNLTYYSLEESKSMMKKLRIDDHFMTNSIRKSEIKFREKMNANKV